jgi:predicted nucleotidyltransferase
MPWAEQAIVTVAERKATETSRRVRAAGAIVEAMKTYARAQGGRFIVFGSFVDGRMKHDSDLDVMIDFDASNRREAWEFLETLAFRFNLPVDLFDRTTTKNGFVQRVETTGQVLS